MGTSVSLNGTSYTIPATGEGGWGAEVSGYLIAIATGLLSKAGGSFTLTADANFGATYGLAAAYFKSRSTPATTGIFRAGNDESIAWRNAANSANVELKVNSSDVLEFDGNPLVTLALGTAEYVLKMNAGGTAYEWGQILNAGISASAAIDAAKLSSGVVSNTEFDYLNGVTSAIQTQIDAKAAGAASSTDNAIARYDSTTGKVLQNSGVTIDDSDVVSGATQMNVDNLRLDGNTLSSTDTNGDINLTPDGTGKTATTRPLEVSGTSSYIKIPSLTTAQRDALSAAAGQVIFNSETSAYEAYDGSAWAELGSGGSGGINYIDNGDFESTVDGSSPTGWTDDSNFTIVAEDTDTTNSPLRGTVSGYLVATTSASANEEVYYAFTLDNADKNRLMRLSFDYRGDSNYTAEDIDVLIYDVTNTTYITPSVSAIGAGPGRFEATFVTTDSTSYRLVFQLQTATTDLGLLIDDVRVTPELTVTANPETEWETVTLTSTYTNTTVTALKKRVGDTAYYRVRAIADGGAPAGGIFYITLDETIDTTKLNSTQQYYEALGSSVIYDDSTGTDYVGTVCYNTSTRVSILAHNNSSYSQGYVVRTDTNVPFTWAQDDSISMEFSIPIAAWTGSVVTTANSRVEYVYNTSTSTTASDTSSFGTGPTGAQIQSITATLLRRVEFQNAIQPTDKLWIEVSEDQDNWYPLPYTANTSDMIVPQSYDGTNVIGIGFKAVSGSDTQVDVRFGSHRLESSVTWAAVAADYWRVCKSSNPLGIGVGLATDTAAGAITRYQTTTVAANGSFTAGNLICTRIANVVTITADQALTHTSASSVSSSSGLIPSDYVPSDNIYNTYVNTASAICRIIIKTDGTVTTDYYDYAGSGSNQTSTITTPSISYVIT